MIPPIAQQIVDERNKQLEKHLASQETGQRDAQNLDKLFTILALYLDHVVRELQDSVLHTEVSNFPHVQPIAGSVEIGRAVSLESSLEKILQATLANKVEFPGVQSIGGKVEVTNFPAFPDIKIPEYPKQIKTDVVSLPKYVGEKLDAVKAAIQNIPAPIVNVPQPPAPQVHVDLQSVVSQLEVATELLSTIANLEAPEVPETDLTPVIRALAEVKRAVIEKPTPVPNFVNSYQRSIDMQTKDMDLTYTYVTILGKQYVSSIVAVADGGTKYQKDYTYDAAGNVLTTSRWMEQSLTKTKIIIRGLNSPQYVTRGYASKSVVTTPLADGNVIGLFPHTLTYTTGSGTPPPPPPTPGLGEPIGVFPYTLTYGSSGGGGGGTPGTGESIGVFPQTITYS